MVLCLAQRWLVLEGSSAGCLEVIQDKLAEGSNAPV